jgi:hypothetical protein
MRQNVAEVEPEDKEDCDTTDTVQLRNDGQFGEGLPRQECRPLFGAEVISSVKIAESGLRLTVKVLLQIGCSDAPARLRRLTLKSTRRRTIVEYPSKFLEKQ